MLVTNHVVSGALVGLVSTSPARAFAAGVASHLVLDAVPHWGDRPIDEVMPIAVADGLTGLTAMAVLWTTAPRHRRLSVLAGMTGAALLDLDKPGTVFFGRSPFPQVIDDFHARIQTEYADRMWQELVVGAGLVALWALSSRGRGRR